MDYLVDFLLIFAVVAVILIPVVMVVGIFIQVKWYRKFYGLLERKQDLKKYMEEGDAAGNNIGESADVN